MFEKLKAKLAMWRVDNTLKQLGDATDRLKFNGIVLYQDKGDYTYTFFKLYQQWVMVMDKDKKVLCSDILSAEQMKKRFNLDVSKFV